LTQEEMARKLGISRQAYNNIEQGKTVMINRKLPRIADQLCISVDHLLLGYDPAPDASSLRQELHEKEEKLAYSERERREMQIRLTDMQEMLTQQSGYIESLKKIEKYQTDQLERLLSGE
jgi:transcriptional regulator with XRE-family HTH domain